jgi:hypothetical protein
MLHRNTTIVFGAGVGMGWVWLHRRHGAVLALIALALQIVVAFGHVHLHALTQSPHATSAQRAVLADNKSHTPAQIPANNDDYCAICASIFLASSAFAPAPPQLLVPANFQRVEHSLKSAQPLSDSLRLAFRSRAPPTA